MTLTSIYHFWLFLSAFLLVRLGAHGANRIVLNDQTKSLPVTRKFIEYFEDTTSVKSIYEIERIYKGTKFFRSSNANDLINENTNSVYWLRFTIADSTSWRKDFILEIFDFDIDEVTFYIKDEKDSFRSTSSGYKFPFSTRLLDHKNLTFPLLLPAEKATVCYIKFKSAKRNILEPIVRTYQDFVGYSLKEYLLFGFFYGIIYLNLFFNFIYYLILRKSFYLYYVLYISGIFLYLIGVNGIGFQFIWGHFPKLNNYISCLGL